MRSLEPRIQERNWLRRLTARQAAIRLALGYTLVSVLWILLSGRLVEAIAPNQEVQMLLETVKGWLFIAVTAYGLYYFVRRTLGTVHQLDDNMVRRVLEHQADIDRYHMLLDASSDHIILFDPQKRYIAITDRTASLRHVTASQLLGRTPAEVLDPASAVLIEQILNEVIQTKKPSDSFRELVVDGVHRWFSTIYNPVLNADGELTTIICVGREVTEHVRAEQAAERHSKQLAVLNRVLLAASQPVDLNQVLDALLSQVGELFEADASAIHILDTGANRLLLLAQRGQGLSRQEQIRELPLDGTLVGKAVRETRTITYTAGASPDGDRPLVPLPEISALAITPIWARDHILGTVIIAFQKEHTFSEEDKAVLEALGRGIGITIENARLYAQAQSDAEMLKAKVAERTAELEEALVRAQSADRMKSGLLSTVSHEMRTPLSSIIGFSNLILSRKPEQTKLLDYVSAINAEARRLAELINDFLDLQRIESGREVFHPSHVDIAELTRDVISKLQITDKFVIHLHTEPVPWLYIDANRIRQVLLNLFSNAIKYSPQGGEITVSLRQDSGEVLLSIQDQGVGIAPEELSQLFERFYRGDIAERFRIRGTGLGLALCQQIIDAHNGRIWAESPGLNHGSTFTIALPVPPLTTIDMQSQRLLHAAVKLIVVAEDSANFSSYLADRLKPDGYFVQGLDFKAASADYVVQLAPALVILDILQDAQHPGWLLLADLKQHPVARDIPVLVCSSGPEHAWELGASSFVAKPVDEEFMMKEIVRLIGKPPRRVLIVDDEAITRLMLNDTLVAAGYQTETVADGERAIEALKQGWPDLLILDLLMPKINGFGVLEWIRVQQHNFELPVIVLTAAELTPAEQAVVREEASALAVKSNTSPQQLLDLVRQIIAAED